jgi:ubiquinone/menaquinone biosynthesis C-methylase UbiE
MRFSKFFSKQAKKPSGLYGRFRMSKVFDKGNLEMNTYAKQMLDIKVDDNVLEIGCGTGMLIKEISRELETGKIDGIDFSKTMVSVAMKNNKSNIRKEKVQIYNANFDKFPFQENFYDKIISINTIYFWENPDFTISKISKLLKPNGKIVIGFHLKEDMSKMDLDNAIFRLYSKEEVIRLLNNTEKLKNVTVETKDSYPKCICCATGERNEK